MRRRQIFAAQTAAREAALSSMKVGTPFKPAVSDNVAHWPSADGSPPAINACPKCGKVVTRGKFMHQKYCKGIAT